MCVRVVFHTLSLFRPDTSKPSTLRRELQWQSLSRPMPRVWLQHRRSITRGYVYRLLFWCSWCISFVQTLSVKEASDSSFCSGTQAMLKTSRRTLQVLQHVYGPRDGRLWAVPSHLSLTRFGALRSLTLHECPALGAYWLRCLPTSLRSLTFCVALHDRESAEELRFASTATSHRQGTKLTL